MLRVSNTTFGPDRTRAQDIRRRLSTFSLVMLTIPATGANISAAQETLMDTLLIDIRDMAVELIAGRAKVEEFRHIDFLTRNGVPADVAVDFKNSPAEEDSDY